jgi:hypothetical protein
MGGYLNPLQMDRCCVKAAGVMFEQVVPALERRGLKLLPQRLDRLGEGDIALELLAQVVCHAKAS